MDYRELAQKLKPYIAPWIVAQGNSQAASSAVSGMAAHALSGAYHTGTLAQSQAPWAVTDDEFAVHTGNPDAHHARATGTAPLVVTGQDVSLTLGHGVETSSSALRVKLPTNSGLVRDSTGVYLSPATVGPDTTNGVTGSGHTHTVDSSSNPGAAAKILETAADGSITLKTVTVSADFTAAATAFRVINHTHDYPHTHVVVNPGVSWTLDEQFGVDIDDNLLVRGYIVGKHAIQLSGALLIAHFDGPEPYETNFKGEANGHMGQVATVSGGVIYRAGKFGKAVQAAGAVTNLCPNPSFETNTTGWTLFDANGSVTMGRTTFDRHVGDVSLHLHNTTSGSDDFAYCSISGLSASTAYTVSAWAYVYSFSGAATSNRGLFAFDVNNGAGAQNAAITAATSGWVRYSVTVTMSGSPGNLEVRLYAPGGDVFWDAVQVEQGSYATPYCDGSLGDGHAWSGTAHASTSSRTAAALTYPTTGNLNSVVGTIMAWVNPAHLNANPQTVLRASGSTAGHIFLRLYSSGKPQVYWGTAAVSAGSAIAANTWTHLVATYDGATASIYVNGALVTSGATSGFDGMPSSMSVGVYSGAEWFNGLIDDLVVLDRAVSADEIRAVYESNAPVFAETSTWHWRSGRNRVWADAEGLWMLGASGSAVLGAYAGDDTNPSATKSWGGATLSEGDVVIGHNQSGSAAMVWDKSAGKFQFVGNGSGTVQAEIDTQGRVSAGGGKIVLGQYGARLALGSSRTTYLSTTDGARIMWSAAEIYEALEEEYTYLSTSYYRRSLVARTITGFGTNVSHTEIAALHETTSGSGSYRGPRIILESGGHLEDYTTTYGVDDVAIVVADMLDIQAAKVLIADSSLGGQLTVSQGSSTGAKPPLIVGQSDVSEEMIRFNGTVATGNTINTDALGAYYGRVKVSINGTAKWLALYS